MQPLEDLFKRLLLTFQQKNKKWFGIVMVIIVLLKAATDYLVPTYIDLGSITPMVIDWVTFIWGMMTTVVVASSKEEEKAAEAQQLYEDAKA